MPQTPNYGWLQAEPGTNDDTWGQIENEKGDAIDAELKRVEDKADGKLDAAGTAASATKLATPFTLSLSGATVGSASIDGSGNVTMNVTIPANAINIAAVSGLQSALNGKAAASHTHTIANVTGLQAALDGKEGTLAADRKRVIHVGNSAPSDSLGADGDVHLEY